MSRAPREPRRRRRRVGSILVLALTGAGIEAFYRWWFEPLVYFHNMPFEPELGFRMHGDRVLVNQDEAGKFEYRLNSLGFRGPELPAAEPKGARQRLAFVGDSMLTAWAVRDERLMTLATGAALAQRGIDVDVFSLGADDYGTAQELLLYRRHADELDADAVVLIFTVGNDILNNGFELAGRGEASGGDYLRPYFVPTPDGGIEPRWTHPARAFLRARLQSAAMLEHLLLSFGESSDIGWLRAWDRELESPEARLARGAAPMEALEVLRAAPPDEAWSAAWDASEAMLRAFRDEVEAGGARFLVLVIPHVFQVERNGRSVYFDWRAAQAGAPGLSDVLDWNAAQERLRAFFERESIEYLDILEPLREAVARSGRTAFMLDGHMHARAHDEIVPQLAAWYARKAPEATAPGPREPVNLMPEPVALPRHLDFRGEPHAALLAGGWHGWRRDWGDGHGGWAMDQGGVVFVRPDDGELVLRGWLPEAADPPVTVRVVVHGVGEREGRIQATGPFELRLAADLKELAGEYVPFHLRCDKTFEPAPEDPRRFGLVLREIAFESR